MRFQAGGSPWQVGGAWAGRDVDGQELFYTCLRKTCLEYFLAKNCRPCQEDSRQVQAASLPPCFPSWRPRLMAAINPARYKSQRSPGV
ncbi:hypothetical protein E2C01_033791 [Portunus trituberculatus]|uniref:Uncharacterized protein n=1 Tax=Portunus trituberculatus TaxID=210409 RepID=A0A5B7F3M4_PORTR|nr:hypothetical protein [Portunus trituberculatus]